jgi:hypothetical protein
MNGLLRLRKTGPQWPYTVGQFRADEPQLSISSDPHPGELATYATLEPPILVFQVQPADAPEYDPTTHRLEEVTPVEVAGAWRQSWELIELPPALPAPPAPDWTRFKAIAMGSDSLKEIMLVAYQENPQSAGFVATGLKEAERGELADFATAWAMVVGAANVPPEVIAGFVAVATACHLPAEFVAALELNRERARDEQGRFIADDPATPQDEAWV